MSDRDSADSGDGLKNPMRFTIKNRTIDMKNCLRHPDFDEKRATEIEIVDGQLYVHWKWADGRQEQSAGGDGR